MLKYLKKQISRRDEDDDDNNADVTDNANTKRNSLRSTSSFCDEIFFEEENQEICEDATSIGGQSNSNLCSLSVCGGDDDEDIFKYRSRLSMSLITIINDPNCLCYFVQFLETKNALALIKFYLDTNNFKTVARNQLQKQNTVQVHMEKQPPLLQEFEMQIQDKIKRTSNNLNDVIDNDNDDDEKNNSVPELKSLYDINMRRPLTDDEKSQIYAATTKQHNKCDNFKIKSNTEISLCGTDVPTTTKTNEHNIDLINLNKIHAASVKDAIAIYQKYLIGNAKLFVSLPITILSQISLLLCKNDCDQNCDELSISAQCFDEAQQYVLQKLEQDYFDDFLQSSFYSKYCIELIDGGITITNNNNKKLNINDILYSEATLFFFMEFLEQHGERECLDFWTTAINYRKGFINDANTRNDIEAQSDAMIIYDKFFSLQAESRLWMSNKLRCRVEQNICDLENIVYCFDLPLRVTAKYLSQKYFQMFLKSQLFENYFNELKTKLYAVETTSTTTSTTAADMSIEMVESLQNQNTVQQKLNLRSIHSARKQSLRHRKTKSDCTINNICESNTLLAMDTSKHFKNLHTTAANNLNIDSRQLTNPKLLWHRSISTDGGLKFGHVNALGRYERDFEAVDAINGSSSKHNWSLSLGSNKIKNAMRKLVNLPEDKVQEEIAWQVAEMIVKDVTNVTLNNVKHN